MIKGNSESPAPAKQRKATAETPPVPSPPTIACVECAEAIPAGARKCSKCSSYQNWRRHIPFGQSTLALVISVIALGSSLALGSKAIMETASGFLTAPNFRLGVAVVSLDEEKARVLLSNSTGRNIVVKDIDCGLNIPIDAGQMSRDILATRLVADTISDIFLPAQDTIGLFLVSYQTHGNVVIPPNGRILVEGLTKHISSPSMIEPLLDQRFTQVASYCTASGVDELNEMSIGAVSLPIGTVLELDVEAFLGQAEFSPVQEVDRSALAAKVAEVRAANKAKRVEGVLRIQ